MRAPALTALVVVAVSCGFPEYHFPEESEAASLCDPNPCQHEGECIDRTQGYLCLCADGFSGDHCEIDDSVDDCADNPCENGGECVDGANSYSCDCPRGFEGDRCETNIDDCTPDPCQNDGECEDAVDDYICHCMPGFEGHDCEDDHDDCVPDPCQNGGKCTDALNNYTCDCPEGFTGDTCSGEAPATCRAILEADPSAADGVYSVDPDGPASGKAPIDVRCDMQTDGGGWTLVAREAVGSSSTLRFLASEEGLASELAELTGNGLMGIRFAGLYSEVRIDWSGESSGYIYFRTSEELFANTVDTAIPIEDFTTSDASLESWVGNAGGAVFCRASQSIDIRPGDTSWGIKPASDTNVECGCSGSQWKGQGAYYGGSLNATSCTGYGGGWAAARDEGQAKGGYTTYESVIWIR